MQLLPTGVQPVAVAYADWRLAESPRAEALLPIAAAAGASYLLVDTFDKTSGHLLDHMPMDELAALAAPVTGDAGRSGPEVTRRVLGVAQWVLGQR